MMEIIYVNKKKTCYFVDLKTRNVSKKKESVVLTKSPKNTERLISLGSPVIITNEQRNIFQQLILNQVVATVSDVLHYMSNSLR